MNGGPTNLRINGRRLWDSLMQMAEIGATRKGGVRRLALGPVDKEGRDAFRRLCEQAGLSLRIDAMGNMFARRPGRDPGRLPVLLGSHLDSQPSGGKFDGALGVLAGLEIMHTLDDLGLITEAPLELVNWTDEEGSRFGRSLMGSGVWSGVYDQAETEALADLDGQTVGASLDAIGYRGDAAARQFPADSYFELHIEQGPILERKSKQVGIVTGAQAQVWYDLVLTGQDSHAGTTPPDSRRDALLCAARVIELVDRLMRMRGEDGRGTVGQLVVLPNSRNVVPGEVRMSAEFRHPADTEISRVAKEFCRETTEITKQCRVELQLSELFRIRFQPFDEACVGLVRSAAKQLGYSSHDIVSGAGHDAVYIARHIPTAMIFTPCKDGLSHNEAESIEPDDAEAGAQVLFQAVIERANRPL